MKNFYKKAFLATMLTMSAAHTFAHDFEVDGIYYNITDTINLTVEVTYPGEYPGDNSYIYEEFTDNVSIPKQVNYGNKTYVVTTIGDCAFYGAMLESVEIPNSVTTIGNGAFYGCAVLTSVTIGRGVKTINDYVFFECTGLTSVEIPNGVTTIGEGAFSDCTGLTSVTIGSGVETIGKYAFSVCTAMKSLTCEANTPPTCGTDALTDIDKDLCTLYVPSESISLYQEADQWLDFYIVGDVVSGINSVTVEDENKQEVARYNLNGQRIDAPQQGINIIKYSDGTIKKVYVK